MRTLGLAAALRVKRAELPPTITGNTRTLSTGAQLPQTLQPSQLRRPLKQPEPSLWQNLTEPDSKLRSAMAANAGKFSDGVWHGVPAVAGTFAGMAGNALGIPGAKELEQVSQNRAHAAVNNVRESFGFGGNRYGDTVSPSGPAVYNNNVRNHVGQLDNQLELQQANKSRALTNAGVTGSDWARTGAELATGLGRSVPVNAPAAAVSRGVVNAARPVARAVGSELRNVGNLAAEYPRFAAGLQPGEKFVSGWNGTLNNVRKAVGSSKFYGLDRPVGQVAGLRTADAGRQAAADTLIRAGQLAGGLAVYDTSKAVGSGVRQSYDYLSGHPEYTDWGTALKHTPDVLNFGRLLAQQQVPGLAHTDPVSQYFGQTGRDIARQAAAHSLYNNGFKKGFKPQHLAGGLHDAARDVPQQVMRNVKDYGALLNPSASVVKLLEKTLGEPSPPNFGQIAARNSQIYGPKIIDDLSGSLNSPFVRMFGDLGRQAAIEYGPAVANAMKRKVQETRGLESMLPAPLAAQVLR